jgi:hypothetical protein
MNVLSLASALRRAIPLAVGVVLLVGGPVQAAATVQSFGYPATPFSGILPADPTVCGMGNDDGFITGTDELDGQFTQTLNGISFHATETFIVRVDLPASSIYGPGAYLLSSSVLHFEGTQHGAAETFTQTASDNGDVLYNAAGTVIGRMTFHLVEHRTTSFPSGAVVVSFGGFRLTCP